MESTVRKNLSDALLKDLSSKENERTRKQLQRARPQLLYLENLDFINDTIKKLTEKGRLDTEVNTVKFTSSDLDTAREIAEKYQNSYIRRNKANERGATDIENTLGGRYLRNKFPAEYKRLLNGEVFMLSSFSQLRLCKQELVKKFIKTTEDNLKKITRAVDRGHGAGDGVAVSGVQIAKGFGRIDKALESEEDKKKFTEEFASFLDTAFDEGEIDQDVYDDLLKIQLEYSQIVTSTGKLSATYIPFITFQDKYTNRVTDKAREQRVLKLVGQFFEKIGAGEITSMEGSSTLEEKAISLVVKNLADIKGATVKVDKKIHPKIKRNTKGSVTSRGKKTGSGGSLKKRKAKSNTVTPGKTSKAKQSTVSTANILGLVNQKLPTRVADKMGSPRLNFQTGRFAGSVRATEVRKTKEGFASIGYRYLRNPYEVFESTSGTRFSSIARDPRSLIDASIREIAAELALGRIYTRRL
jgi:hypothetical protein